MIEEPPAVPEEGYAIEPPMRLHHLTGGLAVLLGANRLAMMLSPGSSEMRFFSLLPKMHLSSTLKMQPGIRFLGGNQFNHADEMRDPVSSNFIIAATNADGKALAQAEFYRWNGIAVALRQMNRESDAMIADRLDNQIRLCKDRFERLSMAYRTTLSMVVADRDPEKKVSFTGDKYAHYLASEYRSLLNELYSLRDAVLAVAYRMKYGRVDSFALSKVRQCVSSAADRSEKLIVEAMFSDRPGLIGRMSLYRAVAQHCLGANNPVLGDVYKIACSNGLYGKLPYVIFPLYDNIEKMREIERGASKGVLERSSQAESIRFMSLPSHVDALEFCYDCFVRLLRICEALATEIGIEPKVTTITDADIIEGTFTDSAGKVTRVKRDEKTGRLIEY